MKLQFSRDKTGKKVFLGASDDAFYSQKDSETISIDGKKEDVKKLVKGASFTIDEKKKTILVK